MFERFTKEAREAVVAAHELAVRSGAASVCTEHLLLGVARGTSAAARMLGEAGATEQAIRGALARLDDAHLLETLGIDLDEVRASVERAFGPEAWAATDPSSEKGRRKGHAPYTADSKKALELSLREALNARSKAIEAGHVLLGLLRTGGRPVEALTGLGVDTAALRTRLQEAMRQAS